MKILVGYVEDLKHSGIDKYLLNVLKIANENNIQLDFLSSIYDEDAVKFLSSFGCKVFKINNLKKPFAHYRDVKKIILDGEYDKAYFNISESLNMMGPKAAHDCKIKTLVHSHSSGMDISSSIKRFVRGSINFICKRFLYRYTDEFLACSYSAAKWLFPKKIIKKNQVKIIYNAVDSNKFKKDVSLRAKIRKNLSINDNTLVIGHIGHYCYQKNNFFLPEILKEVKKCTPDSIMLLIGDGNTRVETENKFKRLGLYDSVKFLGIRTDVADLFQAMDVFVLPSRFEGLPIVAVEAQLSGLPCVLSDRIDSLVKIHNNCEMVDISAARDWAKSILHIFDKPCVFNNDAFNNFSLENNKTQILDIVLG